MDLNNLNNDQKNDDGKTVNNNENIESGRLNILLDILRGRFLSPSGYNQNLPNNQHNQNLPNNQHNENGNDSNSDELPELEPVEESNVGNSVELPELEPVEESNVGNSVELPELEPAEESNVGNSVELPELEPAEESNVGNNDNDSDSDSDSDSDELPELDPANIDHYNSNNNDPMLNIPILENNNLESKQESVENDNILYSNNVINYLNNMFQGIVVNNADYDELNTELDDVILVITEEALDKLEVNLYERIKDDLKGEMCTICSDDFYDEDIVRILPCSHIYHRICIDKWLTTKSYKCPVCRKECGDKKIYN
jgi:hypothetical protein